MWQKVKQSVKAPGPLVLDTRHFYTSAPNDLNYLEPCRVKFTHCMRY